MSILTPRPSLARLAPVAAWALLAGLVTARGRAQCDLTNVTTWCSHQNANGVSGTAEDDDHFAAALAFGDFNGDGFDDLAVGVPGENNGAGVIQVFYSNGFVLTLAGQQTITQADVGGADDQGPEDGDEFGAALVAGDFDHNGFEDLAVGSPGEDLPEVAFFDCSLFECEDTGVVHVILGSSGGLLGSPALFDTRVVGGAVVEGARFGSSLAVGNFLDASTPLDNFDDLAIGAPLYDDPVFAGPGGAVLVIFGALAGPNLGASADIKFASVDDCDAGEAYGTAIVAGRFDSGFDDQLAASAPSCDVGSAAAAGAVFESEHVFELSELRLVQSDYSTAGNGANDHFGAALAAGDFDGNGLVDLAAGAPNKNHGAGNPDNSGRVYVAYSTSTGPDPSNNPDVIGEDEWPGGVPDVDELFGSALAAGDVDGDGIADLLAGAPGEGGTDTGRVYLERGSGTGLTTTNNELFTQSFLGGSNGTDDHLGNVIALGDIDGDGVLEIALGVPEKDVGTTTDSGMVYVTRAFGRRLLVDGFESGNKAFWSASTN